MLALEPRADCVTQVALDSAQPLGMGAVEAARIAQEFAPRQGRDAVAFAAEATLDERSQTLGAVVDLPGKLIPRGTEAHRRETFP